MPRKLSKAAEVMIDLHNTTRMDVERKMRQQGFSVVAFDIAELVGIQKSVETLLDYQGCNHGKIVVDLNGEPTEESEPDWRVKFNKPKEL